ncbi:UNVERIFIED_CONTAM: Serine/threonine-protein kinase TOR [Sesamum indicum]
MHFVITVPASGFVDHPEPRDKLMLSFAPDYDHLPLIAKFEVFEYAVQNREENDLARVGACSQVDWFPSFLIHAYNLFPEMLGAMVKESHFRGLVGQEDKLYKKLGRHEYGMDGIKEVGISLDVLEVILILKVAFHRTSD